MRINRFRTNCIWYGLLIVIAISGIHGQALAHRVTIFAWIVNDMVYTQSRFSGGKPVKNGDIFVYDSQGDRLLSGKTDTAGEFTFKRPGKTDLRIVLNAGMGHGNDWILSTDDIDTDGEKLPEMPPSVSPPKPTVSPAPASGGLTREDIKSIVDRSIDNKLKPMMKFIAEHQGNTPSVTDILGGIGYIFGLVGIGAYIHSRRKR